MIFHEFSLEHSNAVVQLRIDKVQSGWAVSGLVNGEPNRGSVIKLAALCFWWK